MIVEFNDIGYRDFSVSGFDYFSCQSYKGNLPTIINYNSIVIQTRELRSAFIRLDTSFCLTAYDF